MWRFAYIYTAQQYQKVLVQNFENHNVIRVQYNRPNSGRWTLNLLSNNTDVVFHFNVRYDLPQLVMNSHINGAWGSEIISTEFPFDAGQVVVVVEVRGDGYQIIVNGNYHYSYAHRLRPQLVYSIEHTSGRLHYGYVSLYNRAWYLRILCLYYHAN